MTLHETIATLAATFAEDILQVIQSSSLEELTGATNSVKTSKPNGVTHHATPAAAPRAPNPGRLKRRNPEEIAEVVSKITDLLAKNPDGMRAEQIREALDLQAKEMPRVLKEGLAKRVLKCKGQKRATTYFLSGKGGEKSVKTAARRAKDPVKKIRAAARKAKAKVKAKTKKASKAKPEAPEAVAAAE